MKSCLRISVIALLLLLVAFPTLAKKKDDPLATLNFVVIKEENGRPIRNAAVVMHPVDEKGNQERGGLELKTDPQGKCSYDGIPYGKLRIQVLAPGFQTYGQDYEVSQPSMDITIKLNPPTKQYSIYQNHPTQDNAAKAPADEKKPQP